MKSLLIPFLVLAFGVSSCRQSSPDPPAKLQNLSSAYAELTVLNERFIGRADSLSKARYDSSVGDILRSHGYSKEQFAREFDSAGRSPALFRQLCDGALKRIRELQSADSTKPQTAR
jgi:hypothetical protein